MVTPPTSSKPRFLEKVARSTLVLCHAFPQERPTGRSGTAFAGSGKSAGAEVPSFFRENSWRLGRLFTAGAAPILPTGRGFVYETQVPCVWSGVTWGLDRQRVLGHRETPGLGLLYSPIGVPKGEFYER